MKTLMGLTLLTLTVGAVGCAGDLRGNCEGDSRTICAFRSGNKAVGSSTVYRAEIDVPKDARAVYEIIVCQNGTCFENAPAFRINCSGVGCVEELEPSTTLVSAEARTNGKIIVLENSFYPAGTGETFKARVAPNGSFVNGSALQ